MKYFVACFIFLFSTYSLAGIYECKDSKGNISYQDHSCDKEEKQSRLDATQETDKTDTNQQPNGSAKNNEWTVFDQVDEMTNRKQCVIESPAAYVGIQGSDVLFVSIKITSTDDGKFIAALYSKDLASDNGPSFHNETHGLGIKIDKNNFIETDIKISQHAIGFSFENTKLLISEMERGNEASLRVRFWPYDKTFDGHGIPLLDFNRALQALKTCRGLTI